MCGLLCFNMWSMGFGAYQSQYCLYMILYIYIYFLYILVHLYSTFRILLDFQILLYNFSFSCSGHFFSYCIIPLFFRGAILSQINFLESIQVSHLIWGKTSFSFSLSMQHLFRHSLMVDRSMVVGHVLMVHTCSFMCTSYIGMTAHTPAFLQVGQHSGNFLYAHMT